MVETTTTHFWNPPSGGNCAILNPRWKITEEKQWKIVYGEFIFLAASKSIIQVQRGTIFTMLSNSFDVPGSVSWGLSNLTSQIVFSLTFHDPKQQISGLKRKPSSTCSTSHPLEGGRNQENYRTSVLQVREPGPGLCSSADKPLTLRLSPAPLEFISETYSSFIPKQNPQDSLFIPHPQPWLPNKIQDARLNLTRHPVFLFTNSGNLTEVFQPLRRKGHPYPGRLPWSSSLCWIAVSPPSMLPVLLQC